MKKREYLSLGGLFIALHLVFILMSKFLPGSSLLLVIFLPLLSTIYTLKFNKEKVAIFAVATLFLCLLFEPVATLIYVIPSLICGISYGAFRKRKVKELSLVYLSSLAHALSLLISFLFIGLLFKEVEFFSIFQTFINKSGASLYVCSYLSLLTMGIIESFIVHFICDTELVKLGYETIEEEFTTPNWLVFSFLISIVTYAILFFIRAILSVYIIPFVFAFTIPIVIEFIMENKRKWVYIFVGACLLVSMFLLGKFNAIAYPMLIIIVLIPIVMEKIVRVLYTFLLKYSNKNKNIIE